MPDFVKDLTSSQLAVIFAVVALLIVLILVRTRRPK